MTRDDLPENAEAIFVVLVFSFSIAFEGGIRLLQWWYE